MLYKVLAIVAAVCAGAEGLAVDVVERSHEQQPLGLQEASRSQTYDVRRFAINSTDGADEVIRQAQVSAVGDGLVRPSSSCGP